MIRVISLPIVLLHAFPLSSRMWAPLREHLPGLDLITPELRGAAGSPLGDEPPSLDVLADDVARTLDERGIERAIVGGLSMGGYVTMAFLRRHPDRAAAIVLADTKPGPDDENARANRLRIAERLDAEGDVQVLLDDVGPGLLGPTTIARRPQVVALVTNLVAAAPPVSAAWWERAMAARPDSTGILAAFDAPALVIVGAEDKLSTPAQVADMAGLLRDHTLVVVPEAGHLTAIEAPAVFAAALTAFVREVG